ncbi:hypothetical protein [Faecalimonas sp.]
MEEEYEVIRFLERDGQCYIASAYVEGMTLYHWIELHEEIEKEKLEKWIRELLRQVTLFRKQKGNPSYTHLNPYHIIIIQESEIKLLYLEEEYIPLQRKFEKQFQPDSTIKDVDFYCLGKTIQFIMAHLKCVPSLKKREEIKLLSFTKKCLEKNLKKQFKSEFPSEEKFSKQNNGYIKKWIIIFSGVILLTVLMKYLPEKKPVPCKKDDNSFQIGMYYFLERKDYKKSNIYFQKAKDKGKNIEDYIQLSRFMMKQSENEEIEHILSRIKKEAEKEDNIGKKLMVARVCILQETEKSYKWIVEMRLNNLEELSEELRKEWNEYKALAYEKLSLWKEAGTQYRKLSEQEEERRKKEEIYKEKYIEMDISYLKELWKEKNYSEEEKLKILHNIMEKNPQIKETEIFKQFVMENQIQL